MFKLSHNKLRGVLALFSLSVMSTFFLSTSAHASPLCSVAQYCGEVVTNAASRGSSIAIKNWLWSQYSTVTAKSVPMDQRFLVRPGTSSFQSWPDTDGVIARPECTTVAKIWNKLGEYYKSTGMTLTPGYAYKIQDGDQWVLYNNGPNCRG